MLAANKPNHEVHLQDGAREDADEHQREHGDTRAGLVPVVAVVDQLLCPN